MRNIQSKIRVHYFFRRPRDGKNFSIERLFETVISELPPSIEPVILVCPWHSSGVFRRFALAVWAAMNQGDVNHVTGDVDFLVMLMRKRRTVLTIHDCASLNRLSGLKRRLYSFFWIRLPIARSGEITTISDFTKRQLENELGRSAGIRVIANCTTIRSRETEFSRADIKNSSFRILQVGTAINKNLINLIRASYKLAVRLVIIGPLSDEHRAELDLHRCDYENYQNLPPERLVEEYEKSDVVTFVSTYEGFGLPILEAQAIGRPVVTSNLEPMRTIAGAGGILVDPHNPLELADVIVLLRDDVEFRNLAITNGYRNVAKYTPERIARQYAELYENLSE